MKEIVEGNRVSFYDGDTNFMYIEPMADELVWWFENSDTHTITSDMKIYPLLVNIMSNEYAFYNDIFDNHKKDNELVWYSDAYCNPDREFEVKSISYMEIKFIDDVFKIRAYKPLDEIYYRSNKFHGIVFSTGGNGRVTKNINTGLTFQDDIKINIYDKLVNNKVLRK